jgi:hypothetical protein
MSTVSARLAIALAALAACVALAACGGGDDGASTANDAAATTSTANAPASTTTTQSDATTATTEDSGEDEGEGSPESHIAPDAEVAAGLKQLKGVAATVAAAGGGHDARDAVEKVWQPIEGTVKKNEPDLYLDVEDSFQQLASGDAGDAKRGVQRLDQAIDAYLAKHTRAEPAAYGARSRSSTSLALRASRDAMRPSRMVQTTPTRAWKPCSPR